MKRREFLAAAGAGALAACRNGVRAPDAALLTGAEFDSLRQRFNDDEAKLRLFALFSPT